MLLKDGTTSFRGPGSSEYKGIDLEFSVIPAEWLDISARLSYVDAEMTSFSSRGSNESTVLGSGLNSVVSDGKEPRNVPALSGL